MQKKQRKGNEEEEEEEWKLREEVGGGKGSCDCYLTIDPSPDSFILRASNISQKVYLGDGRVKSFAKNGTLFILIFEWGAFYILCVFKIRLNIFFSFIVIFILVYSEVSNIFFSFSK